MKFFTGSFNILLFVFLSVFQLQSQNPSILVPLEMVIVGFDRSINTYDDNLIVTVNSSPITTHTEWMLTNASYIGDGKDDQWKIQHSDYIKYDIEYIGDLRIPKHSYISYRTDSKSSSVPLRVSINGIDKSHLFIIKRTTSQNTTNNKIITNHAFYLKQGRYYESQNVTKFLGTVMDGLFFEEIMNAPSDIAMFKSGPGIDIGSGSGSFEEQLCECEDLENPQNLGKWDINDGSGGIGEEDIDNTGEEDGGNNCPCKDAVLTIMESNCNIQVDIGATMIHCESFVYFEWVIEFLDGTIIIRPGNSFSDLSEIYLSFYETAQVKLIIYCDDCSVESDLIFVDCGDIFCPPKVSEELGQCSVDVTVNGCPIDYSIEWYQVANPDIHLSQYDGSDILNVDLNGCYYYKVYCADCDVVIGDPICFDNCEIDCSIDYPVISATTNSIIVSDYCYAIPDALCTVQLYNLLINNQWMVNEPPFTFPYCFQENPYCKDGLPSECHTGSTHWSVLIDHINTWLSNNGFAGTASWSNDPSHPCFGESGFSVYLLIEGTDANFGSLLFLLNGSETDVVNTATYNTTEIIQSVSYTISNLCEGGLIEWSNGDVNILSSTYPYGSSFEVTVTCPNGCIYVLNDIDCNYVGCQIAYIPWGSGGSNWQITDDKGTVHLFENTSSMVGCQYSNGFDHIIEQEIYDIINELTNCDISDLEICVAQDGTYCTIIINNSPIQFSDISHDFGSFSFNSTSDPCSCENYYPIQQDNKPIHDLTENNDEHVDHSIKHQLVSQKFKIKVFPNPSSQIFNVAITTSIDEDFVMKVYDASGKLISDNKVVTHKGGNYLKLDCADYDAGMYLLQVASKTVAFPIQKLVLIK